MPLSDVMWGDSVPIMMSDISSYCLLILRHLSCLIFPSSSTNTSNIDSDSSIVGSYLCTIGVASRSTWSPPYSWRWSIFEDLYAVMLGEWVYASSVWLGIVVIMSLVSSRVVCFLILIYSEFNILIDLIIDTKSFGLAVVCANFVDLFKPLLDAWIV